jgi:hypothetical protein
MSRTFRPMVVTLALLVALTSASAECLKEISSGEVICGRGPCMTNVRGVAFCAPSRYGTVMNGLNGIVCARGQCVETARGEVICSSVDGGAVFTDTRGVRCYGQCERASAGLCERTVAGH